jgi:hypothetical protein
VNRCKYEYITQDDCDCLSWGFERECLVDEFYVLDAGEDCVLEDKYDEN